MAISSRVPNGLATVVVAAAGTPQKLSATLLPCRQFFITPIKAFPATGNTGNIYIGSAGMVKATGVGVYLVIKTTDGRVNIERPRSDGGIYDLSQWYIDADNNGDGAQIGYEGES